jgi:hypothetical protein
MRQRGRSVVLLLVILLFAGCPMYFQRPEATARRLTFAQLSARLSEPGGYFGSDNLVSNELSYQHVLPKLTQMGVSGGVYLGVGPDQNFTYIAHIKPSRAFMIDIRRDNLLQHLLYKALFMMSRNRIEYLALLFGKPLPPRHKEWDTRSITDLVEYIDRTPSSQKLFDRTQAEVKQKIGTFGFTLNERDYETISRTHRAFYQSGLETRYTIRDRPSPSGRFFPSYRSLLLETDLNNQNRNYLSTEASYQFLKKMQEKNLIVPITGDLSGEHALREVGRYLRETGEKVSAFYTSNVEFYLWRQTGSFERFVENLKGLPIDSRSVVIRSYFNYAYYAYQHPQTVENYFSVQLLQTIDSMVKDQSAGGYQGYYDLVTRHIVDLK